MTSLTFMLLLSAVLLNSCTAIQGQRSSPEAPLFSYNKGVEAYRAQDYTQALTHWKEAIAAAMNLDRLVNWLTGVPRSKTRISRFAVLAPD
ncbi:MAG: hypothetical protein KME12_22780 [Trichocoleus desertorum ATA4-8-CV12]|nr:hypothetical protein [Trichocoleus desertorum ATA4-8-CV12]